MRQQFNVELINKIAGPPGDLTPFSGFLSQSAVTLLLGGYMRVCGTALELLTSLCA